jgi:hypothetical protein
MFNTGKCFKPVGREQWRNKPSKLVIVLLVSQVMWDMQAFLNDTFVCGLVNCAVLAQNV